MPALLLALAQLVPSLLHFAGKDNAAAVADKALAIGQQLTGRQQPDEVVAALKASPELLAKFQEMANALAIAELQEETKRLAEVNATMRAESVSGDAYVRRARPTFLYAMAFTWAAQTIGLMVALAWKPDYGVQLLGQAAGLTTMWSVALGVVGVYVKTRSDDKKTAAGKPAPTTLESLSSLFKRT